MREAPWECGGWTPPCSRFRKGSRKQVLLIRVSETADRRSEGVWAAPGEESSGGFTPPGGAASGWLAHGEPSHANRERRLVWGYLFLSHCGLHFEPWRT